MGWIDGAGRSPLLSLLARQVSARGGDVGLRSEGERREITFRQLGERIDAWARALPRDGLVALATGNVLAFPELFFALRAAGAAVLLADSGSNPAATLKLCRRLCVSGVLHRDPALGGAPVPGAPDPSVRLLPLDDPVAPPAGTALVKLTSGSTVDPRGACFTEEALAEGIDHIVRGMEITGRDRVLLSIPLGHSYGFDNGVLSLAAAGTPLVLQPDVLPAALLATLRAQAITFFPAVPALVRALAAVDWTGPLSLRSVICASAPLASDVADTFAARARLRVRQFYGATECGGISFEARPDEPAARGTVGFPLPGVRIEIDPEGGVRIHSRANRFALLPERPVLPHVETGDRAAWTPEGRLRLLGRTAHVANIAGVKVDLAAIDAFFRELPGVSDAASMAVDDPARGQRIVSCVETAAHTPAELLELCRRRLSPREVPSELRVVERLPRTERGKLDRAALATLATEAR
jgi:acyl-CoA synthetase (AMP-forming)/AMP-acid ligase II